MPSDKRLVVTAIFIILFVNLITAATSCGAQVTALTDEKLPGINEANSTYAPNSVAVDQAAGATSSGQTDITALDEAWHVSLSPYLWLPGVHGTVGALGRDISVHASPGDLLSHFRFGLMGTFELRHKRLLLPVDMIWVRLGDDKALPFPSLMATTANMKGSEFILTPAIGFRVIDEEKIKVSALAGLRYWHFGQNLQFTPSRLKLSFSSSQNWVDPVVGGRIELAPSPKLTVTILGDAGGWGTGSQLEYEVVGMLGYRFKPKWILQVGYRYLYVDYRSGGSIVDLFTSGALVGVTINLK